MSDKNNTNHQSDVTLKISNKLIYSIVVVLLIVSISLGAYFLIKRAGDSNGEKQPESVQVNLLDARIVEKTMEYERDWDQQQMELALGLSNFPRQNIVERLNIDAPRLSTGHLLMNVNGEDLYTDDLNYYIYLVEPAAYLLGDGLTEETVKAGVERMFAENMIFALSKEYELVSNEDIKDVFNNKSKSFFDRSTKVQELEDKLDERTNAQYAAEKVSIWFYNVEIPEIGLEAARELTKDKIEDLHSRVKSGEISMEEAGNEIKADTSLAEIDVAYQSNAYGKVIIKDHGFDGVTDPNLRETIKNLNEGDLSEIIVAQDKNATDWYDAAFSFVKLIEKTTSNGDISYELQIDEKAKTNIIKLYL